MSVAAATRAVATRARRQRQADTSPDSKPSVKIGATQVIS